MTRGFRTNKTKYLRIKISKTTMMKRILIWKVRLKCARFGIVKNKWNRITGDFMTKNLKQISNWENTQYEKHLRNQEIF